MKKNLLSLTAAALALAACVACGNSEKTAPRSDAAESAADVAQAESNDAARQVATEAGVITLDTDSRYRPGKAVGKVTILDFNATWCVPCKKFAPAFDEAAQRYGKDIDFVSVDIDDNPETKQAFNVSAVPTIIVLDADGKELKRYVGTDELLPTEKFLSIAESLK